MMKLSHLQYLAELKNHRTISKTAEKLFISQPALSVAIKELENELGFDVIKRTKKGVVFTSRGELVLEHCEEIRKQVEAILLLKGNKEGVMSGHLSIGSIPYIFNTVILDTVLEMKERYPQMTIHLKEENSYDLVDLVYQRERDLGVVMISNLEEMAFRKWFDKYHLKFLKLFDDEMHVWVGQQHPLYDRERVSLDEALQYAFISYRNILNEFNQSLLQSYNKELDLIIVDEVVGVRRYLARSQALTIMPMCACWEDPYYEKKILKPLKIDGFKWNTKIGLIYAEDELLSVEETAFIDMVLEKCVITSC